MQLHIFTYQEQDWQEKPLTITVVAKSKDLAVQQLGLRGYDPADYEHQALDLQEGTYIATGNITIGHCQWYNGGKR